MGVKQCAYCVLITICLLSKSLAEIEQTVDDKNTIGESDKTHDTTGQVMLSIITIFWYRVRSIPTNKTA